MSKAKDALLALAEQNIAELTAENEKLRDDLETQRETAWHNTIRNAREYKRVCDENDKLRDWCGEMLDSLMSEICATAHWCEEEDWHTCSDDSCGNYSFVIISRELGIDVPE